MKLRELLSYVQRAEPEDLERELVAGSRLVTGIGVDDNGRLYMSLEKGGAFPPTPRHISDGAPNPLDQAISNVINDFYERVEKHEQIYPGHALQCNCLDSEVRHLRGLLRRSYNDQRTMGPVQRRWAYLLNEAVRNLW